MSDFGQRLRQARKMKGLTQKDLSKKLGVAQSTIANYETNERFPGESALKEIADCLKISADFLLGLSDYSNKNTPTISTINENEESNNLFEVEINHLLGLLIDKRESEAIEYVKNIANKYPPLVLMQSLFEPIMIRVGDKWMLGQLDVSSEHYISGVVEYLITLISQQQLSPSKDQFKVALLVPGSEEHVLPLRMAKEHFRQGGWQVFYIGRSTPVSDFHKLMVSHQIDLVVLSITMTQHLNSAEYFIQALRAMTIRHPFSILVSGRALMDSQEWLTLLQADYYVPTLKDLQHLIPEIEENLLRQRTSD